MADTEDIIEGVVMAEAVPLLPPRPDAVFTLLTSDNHLAGAQTLLYSAKKSLPKKASYPPELVVLVTPNVSSETREALHPVFCTRIVEVDPIFFPANSLQFKQNVSNHGGEETDGGSHVASWSAQGPLTKLHIFRMQMYDVIVYLDADCLVIKDISELFQLGKIYQESEALIAAAPDILPPDKFNAGVLVVRPSEAVFDNMMAQRSLLTTYDGGDTGFLNAYFSEWFTEMPPMARLPFGYNAQRFLFHCTYMKQPNYWDLAVSPSLRIIHFSSEPKPWESKPVATEHVAGGAEESKVTDLVDHLEEDDVKKLRKVQKSHELEALWWKWYQRSKNYTVTYAKEKEDEELLQKKELALARQDAAERAKPKTPKELHKLISARYKDLRKQGLSTKDAMEQARKEYGQGTEEVPASKQVAAMFGVS